MPVLLVYRVVIIEYKKVRKTEGRFYISALKKSPLESLFVDLSVVVFYLPMALI